MATTTKPADKTKGAAEAPAKSKKKLIIMVAVGLLVAGGAYETVLKPKPVQTAAQIAAAKATTPPVYGPIVPLAEQTLNLADGHYLKLTAVIQLKVGASFVAPDAGTVTPAMSAASQTILSVYSGYSQAQLTGTANQKKALDVLVKALNPIFPGQIVSVYMTEFLMSS